MMKNLPHVSPHKFSEKYLQKSHHNRYWKKFKI